MARNDIPTWTIVGVFIGMVTSALVNQSYAIVGAIIGGFIGYIFARSVR